MEDLYIDYSKTKLHHDPEIDAYAHLSEEEFNAVKAAIENRYGKLTSISDASRRYTICVEGMYNLGAANDHLSKDERIAEAKRQDETLSHLRKIPCLDLTQKWNTHSLKHQVTFSRKLSTESFEEWKTLNELGPKPCR